MMHTFIQTYSLKDNRQLTLRSPKLDDAQGLIDQIKQVDQETKYLAREKDEFSFTLDQERDFIINSLEDDNRLFIVAEVDGVIVGTCAVGLISMSRRFKHRANLGIALCKSHWQLGIGSHMLKACINWCKEKGIEQIELDVVSENTRAKAMYESFGFKVYGTKKHALKYTDGTYADELFMILDL